MQRLNGIKEEIRSSIKLSQVVERLTGKQLKGGKMCCPFHLEKTPSFFVSDSKGVYFCHGCGASGDMFSFVMRDKVMSFQDAIKFIDQDFHLGFTGARISVAAQIALRKRAEEQDRKIKQQIKLEKQYDEICRDYRIASFAIKNLEVFSDLWCYYMEQKILLERRIEECMHMMSQS